MSQSRWPSVLLAVSLVLTCVLATPLWAQSTGRITGRVLDGARGHPVNGAVVELVGSGASSSRAPEIQATTALDGRYTLEGVPAGPATVRVRMIGFQAKTVTGVEVPRSGPVQLDVVLATEVVQLAELEVTAAAGRGSVAAALNEQRYSVNLINAITAEEIARAPDGDAAAAVQRVSGVTVQDGRYVFVRGLGERYTTTSLNGARIPSPEPERKIVPLDLFPSGLLQTITTSKTFTPDLPGDMSGAQVNIQTREFPARRHVTISTSAGFNARATGQDVLRAPSAGLEWLALGARDRRLPAIVRQAGTFEPMPSRTTLNGMINSFRRSWTAPSGTGSPSSSVSLSLGGNDPLFGHRVGYLVSGTYSYSQEVQADQVRAYAQPLRTPGEVREIDRFEGSTGRAGVLLGGLVNLSTLLGSSNRLAFNTSYNRTADNDARREVGDSENHGGRFRIDRLRYVERSVWSTQVLGEHQVARNHRVDWSGSYTSVVRKEPDRSEIVYALDTDPQGNPLAPAWFSSSNEGAVRTFADLGESALEGALNYQLSVGSPNRPHQVRIGSLARSTSRDTDNRSFSIAASLPRTARELSPEQIFDGRFSNPDDTWLRLTPLSAGGSYQADDQLYAGYGMALVTLSERLEVVGGARVERSTVRVTTQPTVGDPVTGNPTYTDLLPSLGFNLRLSENQALRLSASQTLSRPEYRELAPVQYREVIGGETVFGNPDLRRALIRNYDVRWEWYPTPAEVLSVAVFAKQFSDPIERVYLATSGTRVVTFVNAESADNYGVEVEARKSLGFLGERLLPFGAFANATLMHSRIQIAGGGVASRLNEERAMVGQAPYVVNAGLTYTSTSGAFSATALFNQVGRRIQSASEAPLPDVYEEPRSMVDLSLRFPVIAGLKGKLDLRNLLDEPVQLRQGSVTREFYRTGRIASVGLSWHP